MRVDAGGEVDLELDEGVVKTWVLDQIQSLAMHRLPTSHSSGSRPVLRFADDDRTHPLGRLVVFEGGQFASSYRIAGDQITVVNRNLGGQNMTITVLENSKNAEGKQLPQSYTVQYWNARDGSLDESQSFVNRWTRVGSFDLPASLVVTAASKSGLTVRSIEFTKQRLAKAK